ncbi:MAG: 4a-hydroxytetrahydrobiopterin dehydratase [Candidatus Zixiibacteriota bacterium]
MDSLAHKKCEPCKGIPPLGRAQFEPLLKQINNWSAVNDQRIVREFKFKNFKQALEFVNKLGAIAEEQQHHPDILLYGWNKVKVTYWTHDIGGLSMNDFIMAAKTDRILQ